MDRCDLDGTVAQVPPNVLSAAASPDYVQNKIAREQHTQTSPQNTMSKGHSPATPQRILRGGFASFMSHGKWLVLRRQAICLSQSTRQDFSRLHCVSDDMFWDLFHHVRCQWRRPRQEWSTAVPYHSMLSSVAGCLQVAQTMSGRSAGSRSKWTSKFHHLCVVYSDDLGSVYDVRWHLRRPSRQE